MKIGFFTDGYLPQLNGVATTVEQLATELKSNGHDITIIAPNYPGYKDKANVLRLHSVKVKEQPEIRAATHLPDKTLIKVSRQKFDVIHGHSGGPTSLIGLEIAKIKRVPFVFTYHTLWRSYTHYFFEGRIIKPKVMELLSRYFCNRADYIIAPTEKIKKELLSYKIHTPIEVIPSGINLQSFSNKKRGYLHKKLKLPPSSVILLYAGRLSQEKSIPFILEAFAHLSIKHQDVVLVLAGDGPEREKLEKYCSKLGIYEKTYFLGDVPFQNMPNVYADANIFLFASTTETQGVVILEAMATGLPVILVKDEAFDFLTHNSNALLSDNKVETMAKYINRLLSDKHLYKKLSQSGKKLTQHYSVKKTTKATEKLYYQILRNQKPRPKVSAKVVSLLSLHKSLLQAINRVI